NRLGSRTAGLHRRAPVRQRTARLAHRALRLRRETAETSFSPPTRSRRVVRALAGVPADRATRRTPAQPAGARHAGRLVGRGALAAVAGGRDRAPRGALTCTSWWDFPAASIPRL